MTFVIWGAIHGVIIVLEKALKPKLHRLLEAVNFNIKSIGSNILFILLTFIVVCFAWVFFRANNFNDALYIISSFLSAKNEHKIIELGLGQTEIIVAFLSIIILIWFDHYHKKQSIVTILNKESYVFRYTIYLSIIFIILIFGVYGENSVSEFIYF